MASIRKARWARVGLLAAMFVAAAGGGPALADKVFLTDGGSYQGKVRIEGDRVIVEIPGGSITLDRDRVLRIEPGEDAFATLSERRAKLDARDAAGHYQLGLWAVQNNLPGPARELFAAAVKIQPDHAQANLALGRVLLDNAWADPDAAVEVLRAWVAGGLDGAALPVGRQALAGLLSPADRRAILEQTAAAARHLGFFAQASADYRELVSLTPQTEPQYERLAATADLLKEHVAGLYLVQVDEFAQAVGRPEADEPTRSGYYSLADDAVLECALRGRAKSLIGQGQTLLTAAKAAEVTDAAKSIGLYNQAEETFARADELNANIARSYRVEVRRRLIQIHQAAAEALALRFDAMNKQLAAAVKVRQTYRNHLKQMLSLLDDIQKELEQILALASVYQQELNLVVTWTHEDLVTVKAMRKTLESEQDAAAGPR